MENADVSKIMGTWELIDIVFKKLSWRTTPEPNFLFLAYPYQEIWAANKWDSPGIYGS